MSLRALRELERVRAEFDPSAAETKRARVAELARAELTSAGAVARLHECLCFLRAYPRDARELALVTRALARFARRRDLARFRGALESSGIAGTDTCFRFFQPTAAWLCARFPGALTIEWPEFDGDDALERWLPLLLAWGESAVLDGPARTHAQRLAALCGRGETDASVLVARVGALDASPDVQRAIYEEIDPVVRLRASARTPSRTLAAHPVGAIAFQTVPLRRERPDLAREVLRPPRSIRALGPRESAALVRLTREAMVVRSRDLDAFMAADVRDVRWIDAGEGLAFACLGVAPRDRLLLESVYGFLTLKNGVPIGYVLASALFGSCQVAYNVFEAWRGGEAAWVYARVLAMLRALFGCDSFTVDPYQLGHENEEGLGSGAWWFYQKLGFRPDDRATLARMRGELARIRRNPRFRSSRATLEKLVAEPVFWSLGPRRADVIGRFPLHAAGAAISRALAARGGGDRVSAERACERDAELLLGVRARSRWSAGERRAWTRWAPLVVALPGVERWSTAQKRALVAVVRAKGGRRETDFVRRFDAHVPLRRALCALARVRSSV